jgi:N-methylhydantoinase A/oxoprolinase/acetone carboxylase beta subunit
LQGDLGKKLRIRVGIDVGGTFTKAVAIDIATGKIVGKKTVPTTHNAKKGVSEGVVNALQLLLDEHNISKEEVELVAHSTTQAVNALLEGDVARVGIIGMGVGMDKNNVIKRTRLGDIKLGDKYIKTSYRFIDTSHIITEEEVDQAIRELKEEGAEVIVASEAFGVDDASNEAFVVKRARVLGLPATAGYELTGIYGLEVRTLTAAINASILPKTITTANFVEDALKSEGIKAPLMLMKGDGGITDIHTFRTKPILTILSGPAASVAGALLYLKVVNGIFIEVGGTSTNICVIKNGRPELKYVTIMDHPTCIRSLDVRVLGVAGGSMVRINNKKISDVGPRSAHIASLKYSCFADPEDLEKGEIILTSPRENDPRDYAAIKTPNGTYAITDTCAANALGLIKEGDYAYANQRSARIALNKLGEFLNSNADTIANKILEIASKKVEKVIKMMVRDYEINNPVLIGGGGGASVLVPYIAKLMNLRYEIAPNAEVISSIGVATSMIREEIERSINKPDPNVISMLIEDVKSRAIAKGALPESIIVNTEYVAEKGILRVIASGMAALDSTALNAREIDREEAKKIASEVIKSDDIELLLENKSYFIFRSRVIEKRFFSKKVKDTIIALDRYGRVRLSIENGRMIDDNVLEEVKRYLDIKNDLAPQIYLIDDTKLVDFSSITSPEHVFQAIKEEVNKSNGSIAAIIKL